MLTENEKKALSVTLQKYIELLYAWMDASTRAKSLAAQLEEIEKEKSTVSDKLQDCIKFATLFGFDLPKEVDEYFDKKMQENAHSAERPESPPPIELLSIATGKPKTVRELVLEAAQLAYPNAVKATALHNQLEEAGHRLHDKTVGMTLYRLSQDGYVRRKGREWFFVPESERAENGNSPEPLGTGELELQP